jgi:hypothetical protein
MPQIWTNNAATTLASAVTTNSQTSLTLASGKGALFPNPSSPDYFMVTLDDGTNVEIVKCTARSTDTLTVVRAQEGTTAQTSFAIGTKAELRVTAAGIASRLARQPNVQAVTSSATVTPNADTDDLVVITAQAAGLTIANPTGTPTQGQKLTLRVKDNGTARAITFGTYYRALGLPSLPTTTVINKTLYIGMIYNSTDTKMDVVSVAQE